MPKKQWTQKTNMVYSKVDPIRRFIPKYSVDTTTGCWNWTASTRKADDGFMYGQFSLDGYPEWAHRAAWRLFNGDIPQGMNVCHKCDNPACVNPDHLFLGTQQDNIDDMVSKGRDAFTGERNPIAKLTKEVVVMLRNLNGKISHSTLAKQYGVSRQTISDAISGRTWRHV